MVALVRDAAGVAVIRELHSVFFAAADGRGDRWRRMARVLDHSARAAMPDWSVSVRMHTPPALSGQSASFVSNTHKLDEWERVIAEAPDGAEIVLIDTDTMILGPLDAAFDGDDDVRFTRKYNTARFVLNGGVVVVRVNERSRAFMRAWRERNAEFFGDELARAKWIATYGGLNQSALGSLLEEKHDAKVGFLDCAEWNACYEPLWQRAASIGAKVVHFKSHLRQALFSGQNARYFGLISRWKRFERDALRNAPEMVYADAPDEVSEAKRALARLSPEAREAVLAASVHAEDVTR